jgi:hypothetical protein
MTRQPYSPTGSLTHTKEGNLRINTGNRLTRLLKPVCICLLIATLLFVPVVPGTTAQTISNAGQIQLTANPEGVSGTYGNFGQGVLL